MMWAQLSFQDAISPSMYSLIEFHDMAMTSIILIVMYVGSIMTFMLTQYSNNLVPYETHELETIWTVTPAVILILLALPSLRLLYLLDETTSPIITMKTIGHQWYWSYEYSNFSHLEFDSYMTPSTHLSPGDLRLLEVDNRLVLPWGVETRMLVTAADVIHSWTIPSLGVKVDAIPGRLNQLTLLTSQPSTLYGQCSEICGANHSFMPISLETISLHDWFTWSTSPFSRPYLPLPYRYHITTT